MKDLYSLAEEWGVSTHYENYRGEIESVPEETIQRILHEMESPASEPPSTNPRAMRKPSCHLPRRLRTWGWAVQLYAARSHRSWGIGDLGDLEEIGNWAKSLGAGLLMINPLHAPAPVKPQQSSPYYPSSRVYRSPLYLRVEDVDGASEAGIADLAAQGKDLNNSHRIDRDAIFDLKMEALERIWALGAPNSAFHEYVSDEGQVLHDYATHCVETELQSSTVTGDKHDRIRFHQWIQFLLDQQLKTAALSIPVVTDLAIGVDPTGADAWIWRDVFIKNASIGAPPDEFNRSGQDWGLPPMNPWKLAAASFEPFVKTLKSAFRHAGGVRIDHVMGLFRQFWVPEGIGPKQGGYVKYPAKELLQIVAKESRRHKALVIGEDLGTVEPHVRDEMKARKMLSQKVLWFQRDPPESWPELSMASINTHDMATIAGLWSGSDLEIQRKYREEPSEQANRELMDRLSVALHIGPSTPISDVILEMHDYIAKAPSAIAFASLEDAAAASERPNLPGTMRPENWSLGLPVPLEDLFESGLAAEIAQILNSR